MHASKGRTRRALGRREGPSGRVRWPSAGPTSPWPRATASCASSKGERSPTGARFPGPIDPSRGATSRFDPSPGSSRVVVVEPPPGVAFPDAVACAFDTRGAVLTVAYSDRSVFRGTRARRSTAARRFPSEAVFRALRRRLGGRAAPGSRARARDRAARDVRHLRRRRQRPAVASRRARRANRRRRGLWTSIRLIRVPIPPRTRAVRVMYATPDKSRGGCRAQGGGETSGRRGERGGGRGGLAVTRFVASPRGPTAGSSSVGDAAGNVRVFDLASRTERLRLAAHDAEVLAWRTDRPRTGPVAGRVRPDVRVVTRQRGVSDTFDVVADAEAPEIRLVSCGRDGLVHTYDASLGPDGSPGTYRLEETIDDHDAAVTGARISGLGSDATLVTCGADRKVIFRRLAPLKRVRSKANRRPRTTLATPTSTSPRELSRRRRCRAERFTAWTSAPAVARARRRARTVGLGFGRRAPESRRARVLARMRAPGRRSASRWTTPARSRRCPTSTRWFGLYDARTGALVGRCAGHGDAATCLRDK